MTVTEDGIIAGGMIVKVQCCIRCLSQVRADGTSNVRRFILEVRAENMTVAEHS